jgi:hypothetical protein
MTTKNPIASIIAVLLLCSLAGWVADTVARVFA